MKRDTRVGTVALDLLLQNIWILWFRIEQTQNNKKVKCYVINMLKNK